MANQELMRIVDGIARYKNIEREQVYVDLKKVHFFEPGATGMNLSNAQEPAHAAA